MSEKVEEAFPDIKCQEELNHEFTRLKRVLRLAGDLRVKWIPRKSFSTHVKELSGEVRGNANIQVVGGLHTVILSRQRAESVGGANYSPAPLP